MSRRRDAREKVMQALYALEVGEHDAESVIATVLQPAFSEDEESLRFATKLLVRTLDHHEEVDEVIRKHTRNWDLDRIAVIDRLLLRISIAELLYFPDIPPKVSMNESIELAKKFSTAKSGQFINGILDAALADLIADGRLKKTGRGLVGMQTSSGKSAYGPDGDGNSP